MSASSLWSVRVWKEFRGLSPAWLACLATMVIAAGLGDRSQPLGLIAYFLGAVAVGALSMGHEYNGRTLTMLLSQPARRERLFLEKLGVLAAMLLVLCGVAWLGLFDPTVPWGRSIQFAGTWRALAFGLPLLCGLFVAPWLTMVCRNALAGVVFAVALPATVWIASDITSAVTYGGDLSATVEARDFALDMFWRGTVIVCVLAAAASWWMFMRLEAIDSRGLEVRLPSWLGWRTSPMVAPPASARRHPMWLLAKKELRLQQLTFAVSGLYLVGCFGISLFRESFPQHQITLLSASTAFHGGAIALLAGSLPSAEERQLGTLEWQVLLPMAAWKQWAVKAGIAVGVAMVLALGLPAAISIISSPEIRSELRGFYSPVIALAVLMATAGSLYVSSLSANGLRALLVSLPAVLGVMGFTTYWMTSPIYGRFGMELVLRPRWYQSLFGTREYVLWTLLNILLVVVYAGTLALLMRFAMTNHRSAERGATRVWTQLSWMGGSLMVGSLLWVGMFTFYVDRMNQLGRNASREMTARMADATFIVEEGVTAQDAVVIVFADTPWMQGGQRPFFVVDADPAGRFHRRVMTRINPEGAVVQYSAVAVAKTGVYARLGRDRDQLEQAATPIELREGEPTTITLKFTRVP